MKIKKEDRTLIIPANNKGLVSCATTLYARSIAGIHDSADKQKRTTKSKGKSLKTTSRKVAKAKLRRGEWD